MTLTADFANKVIHSDASITDAVAFHGALRDIEASAAGMLAPVIHTYKEVPLGGGAIFPAIAFINGWTLEFPAGNWELRGGNVDAAINPVAGCYVKVTQAGAYAVTVAGSSSGAPTAAEIAAEILLQAQASPIHSNVRRVNNTQVVGSGIPPTYDENGTMTDPGDPWRPA